VSDTANGPAPVDLKTQIIRFILTGGFSAIVDFGLYAILFKLFGLDVNFSKALSFIAGTTTAYLVNRRWTFQAEPSTKRFFAVAALYAMTFAVQVGLNRIVLGLEPQGVGVWRMLVAFVIAQGTATVINFVVQRAVIFKIR
jgi:putative flippase GtrA